MKIHAVIHASSPKNAVRNVEIAARGGCDGAFLINQGMGAMDVIETLPLLRRRIPMLGVNLLGWSVSRVILISGGDVDAVWSDDSEGSIEIARRRANWKGLWFGGVCFKYGPNEGAGRGRIFKLVDSCTSEIDVVTTSGPGTGIAAPLEKIQAFRDALGRRPLAVASGITGENVHLYKSLVDHALVGTGIEETFGELDLDKIRDLVRSAR